MGRAQAQGRDTDLTRLTEGRRLYAVRCGRCHEAFAPSSRSVDEWEHAVAVMSPRAHLTVQEKALVLEYLEVFAQ